MRKQFLIAAALSAIIIFISVVAYLPTGFTAYADNKKTYALLKENAFLTDAEKVAVTGLPASYYVEVLGSDETYYEVRYSTLTGYILKTDLEVVDYEPITKYASAYFTADNDTHTVLIRSAPAKHSTVLTQIDDGERAILFGSIEGEALTAAGRVWHYVSYGGITGYAYSAQGHADVIPFNFTGKVETPDIPQDSSPVGSWHWVMILSLCIPAVIIMFALFSRTGIKEKKKKDF